jgi:hypothetical protein
VVARISGAGAASVALPHGTASFVELHEQQEDCGLSISFAPSKSQFPDYFPRQFLLPSASSGTTGCSFCDTIVNRVQYQTPES